MGGWKNVNINWWWGTMGGGVDLEMVGGGWGQGNPFQITFSATNDN